MMRTTLNEKLQRRIEAQMAALDRRKQERERLAAGDSAAAAPAPPRTWPIYLPPPRPAWARVANARGLRRLSARIGRAITFIRAVTGPKVAPERYAERMGKCRECPRRIVQFRTELGPEYEYCSACRCPRWRWAELKRKNHCARWKCPIRRWIEQDNEPEPWWWLRIPEEHREAMRKERPSGGSSTCAGCGDNGRMNYGGR